MSEHFFSTHKFLRYRSLLWLQDPNFKGHPIGPTAFFAHVVHRVKAINKQTSHLGHPSVFQFQNNQNAYIYTYRLSVNCETYNIIITINFGHPNHRICYWVIHSTHLHVEQLIHHLKITMVSRPRHDTGVSDEEVQKILAKNIK